MILRSELREELTRFLVDLLDWRQAVEAGEVGMQSRCAPDQPLHQVSRGYVPEDWHHAHSRQREVASVVVCQEKLLRLLFLDLRKVVEQVRHLRRLPSKVLRVPLENVAPYL